MRLELNLLAAAFHFLFGAFKTFIRHQIINQITSHHEVISNLAECVLDGGQAVGAGQAQLDVVQPEAVQTLHVVGVVLLVDRPQHFQNFACVPAHLFDNFVCVFGKLRVKFYLIILRQLNQVF